MSEKFDQMLWFYIWRRVGGRGGGENMTCTHINRHIYAHTQIAKHTYISLTNDRDVSIGKVRNENRGRGEKPCFIIKIKHFSNLYFFTTVTVHLPVSSTT